MNQSTSFNPWLYPLVQAKLAPFFCAHCVKSEIKLSGINFQHSWFPGEMAGGVPPQPEIQIQVHSKKGSNSVYPLEPATTTTASSGPGFYREIKHFKKWFPWLIPSFVIVNVVTFLVTMYVNNCPHNSVSCVVGFLGRFSFQPFSENPLLGPSSTTYVSLSYSPFFFLL